MLDLDLGKIDFFQKRGEIADEVFVDCSFFRAHAPVPFL